MIRLQLPALLLGLCAAALTASAQNVLSGMAAVVNNDIITFGQVRDLVAAREEAARASLTGTALVEKVKEIRLAALNELINRQLILQSFQEMKEKQHASIPAHILDEHIDTLVREQFGGDRPAFLRTLAAQDYTLDRFRQMEEEKIIVQAMRGQHMSPSTIIPEPRIREYYLQHQEQYSSEEQVKLRMLVMKKSAGSEDSRHLLMQDIRQKIAGGAAFGDLARMYTEDEARQAAGGDWGWVNRKTLSESLTKTAFSLKPGEVSRIVELGGNDYLLFCEARKSAIVRPLAELHDEIEKTLVQQERQQSQEAWLAGLRKKAFIKIY